MGDRLHDLAQVYETKAQPLTGATRSTYLHIAEILRKLKRRDEIVKELRRMGGTPHWGEPPYPGFYREAADTVERGKHASTQEET